MSDDSLSKFADQFDHMLDENTGRDQEDKEEEDKKEEDNDEE